MQQSVHMVQNQKVVGLKKPLFILKFWILININGSYLK
jgi:hypothetical protein